MTRPASTVCFKFFRDHASDGTGEYCAATRSIRASRFGQVLALAAVLVCSAATPVRAQICGDVNDDNKITTSDAQRVLKAAVGQQVDLVCTDQCAALETRLAAVEALLAHVTVDGKNLVLTNMNFQVVSGDGETDGEVNGTGNIIIGYDEADDVNDEKSGSHNLVIGKNHSYASYGGIVAGDDNEITGASASVLGGASNSSDGVGAVVLAGSGNQAGGNGAVVLAGSGNHADGEASVVAAGEDNESTADFSSVVGGTRNSTEGDGAVVIAGLDNQADGEASVVVAGEQNRSNSRSCGIASGAQNVCTGIAGAVSGGIHNLCDSNAGVLSGGSNRILNTNGAWLAGSLFQAQ